MERFSSMPVLPLVPSQEELTRRLIEGFSVDQLEDSGARGLNSKFYELKGRPDLIVRVSEGVRPDAERLAQARVLFADLESRGVAVVPTEYTINKKKDSEDPVVYAISERLDGRSLERMDSFSPEVASELDTFYRGYLSHIEAAYAKQGEYVFDFHYNQCMQGKRPGHEESELYFTDVEPFLGTFDQKELEQEDFPTTAERKFISILWGIAQQIAQVEKKTQGMACLEKSREALHILLEKFSDEDTLVANRMASIRKVLEGK